MEETTANKTEVKTDESAAQYYVKRKPSALAPKEDIEQYEKEHPPTNYCITFVHLLKGNVGPGCFAMGDAFKNGGLVVGSILTIFIALISVHCQHMLIKCSDKMRILKDEVKHADYADTVQLCFENGPRKLQTCANTMKLLVNLFICVTQLGFCCIYIVFISKNIQEILANYDIIWNVHLIMLLSIIPIWITCLITNLKWLMPVSLIANVCMILGLCITLYFALKDGLTDIEDRKKYTNFSQLSLYFGTAIFAFEGIALVLPLKNSMKVSRNFDRPMGVLNVGMVCVTLLFMFAGAVGYLKWGEDVAGSLTLNLGKTILAESVKVMVSLGVLFGYSLQFFIAIQIMWPSVRHALVQKCPKMNVLCGELLFRTILVLITLAIAELVPQLGLFISLIGSLCSTALALVFPPVIELLLRDDENKGPGCCVIFKNIIILLIGLVGFSTGSYESIRQIIQYFKTTDNLWN